MHPLILRCLQRAALGLLAGLLLAPAAQATGTIYGVNHTHWAINRFSVDGRSAVDIIGAYQGGGGLAATPRPSSGSRG